MKTKIFRSICGISLLCVLLACTFVTGVLYKASFDNMVATIRDEAVYVVASLNAGDHTPLEATKRTFTRITLVDPDGTVVYDSEEAAQSMENHAARPEIAGALQSGAAESRRYSQTLAQQTYYRAVRLQSGQVVRVSGDIDSVWGAVLKYLPFVALLAAATLVVSSLAARMLARRIATPINNMDLDRPLENDVYDELSPLLRRMNQQRQKIQEQLEQMEQQRSEFTAITENMREGLVLLGGEGEVLSINRSAQTALGLRQEDCVGKSILHFNRDKIFQQAVAEGLAGGPAEAVLPVNGREYQLLVSPDPDGQSSRGAVLLLLDVTEKQQAEMLRREFSANVSHELKTPLTSISGFAEIVRDGIAKPEDIPQFAGRIHSEARRLVHLVEDILRLSRLDEQRETAPREPLDLLAVATDVAERLAPQAEQRGVALTVKGEHASISGVAHIVEEMVGNLCDNAIKYNRRGGSVEVSVADEAGAVLLTVADTGIGIPPAHQERVFERFYRVDKSHSKETGGTGLGLSIVKHGAMYHHARLELSSEKENGTAVRIWFPKQDSAAPPPTSRGLSL